MTPTLAQPPVVHFDNVDDILTERERAQYALEAIELSQSLKRFAVAAWPLIESDRDFLWNWHMDLICQALEKVYSGEIKRLIIMVPPRSSKSTLVSVMYPAWMWTKKPGHQLLTLSYAHNLAVRDSVRAKTIMESIWYRRRWGDSFLFSKSQSEKEFYVNTKGGHRNAQGIHAGLTGKGGDTIIIDDPMDAEKAYSEIELDNVKTIYDEKISTRLNSPAEGAVVVIMQRLHERDLVGHLLSGEEKWEVVCLPMEYEGMHPHVHPADPRTAEGELLVPDRMPIEWVTTQKKRLGAFMASAQFQQRPSPQGGGILKSKYWQPWPEDKHPLPNCVALIHSWDTAFTEEDLDTNAYSAMISIGIFIDPKDWGFSAILLDAWHDHVDFIDLLKKVVELNDRDQPDLNLIEKKASGQSLIQALRRGTKRKKVPIVTFSPGRWDDKVSRAWSIQPIFEQKRVYYVNRNWAHAVINECAKFPKGDVADWVDCVTQSLIFMRERYLVSDDGDEKHKTRIPRSRSKMEHIPAYG